MRISYAEKLRDPRWMRFKREFLDWREVQLERSREECDECGQDTGAKLHVHHTVYHHSADPWDYDFEEMRLYCETCHYRIHDLEREFAAFIRSLEPHECYEFRDLFYELQDADRRHILKYVLAHCKSRVRELVQREKSRAPRLLL